MSARERYGLTRVINARGTYTPLGVSRSSAGVREAVDEALADFYVMDELQSAASRVISGFSGAEAGAVVHCASAGITLAIAATMTGTREEYVAQLPDSTGMKDSVVLPAGHAVDYGHPIVQDIRLAGARPVLAGTVEHCAIDRLAKSLDAESVACLLLVSSRLVRGEPISLGAAVAQAHQRRLPVIIDGAAQDMRVDELLATGADLVIVSAQKYLGAPTAGLVIGSRDLVAAVRAQEKGIGRSMKATKEGILGALAAIRDRERFELRTWRRQEERKVSEFARRADRIPGIRARVVPDPAGMPISRVELSVDGDRVGVSAVQAADVLRTGNPPIYVMEEKARVGILTLELVPLDGDELGVVLERLSELANAR